MAFGRDEVAQRFPADAGDDEAQQEVVRVGPVAADADGGALSWPPVQGIHIARLRAMADVRAGHGQHQVDQHAAIEWKIVHSDGFDDFAHRGIGGMKGGRDVADIDDFLYRGDFKTQVQHHLLSYFKSQTLAQGRKPGNLHLKNIVTGEQSGDLETSLVVAGDAAHRLRAGRRQFDLRSGKGFALRVVNCAA